MKLVSVTSAQAGIIGDGSAKTCSMFSSIASPIVHHQESLVAYERNAETGRCGILDWDSVPNC